MLNKIYELLGDIKSQNEVSFLQKGDFWISLFFNFLGLYLAYLAYKEANRAKEAAEEAANSVRAVGVSLGLSEIAYQLERIDINIQYTTCRTLLSETHRKTRQLTATYKNDPELSIIINKVESTLGQIEVALYDVRPINETVISPLHSVYWAIECFSSPLVGHLGELIGAVAKRTQP
ncbi:hypothetical protein [Fibrella forsythiae]|uniref:Uncharacterized protein n=1 Tax=Fibrella forsythiae TaxID=2817061 RepID=A0ABS3JDI2_9BACT|nr:hypothetical protein [Fibrella forsythiae]MBO0947503.1 hypothetical protein [Fibrella forsythiae]